MELSKVIALLSRNCSQVLAIVLEWQNLKLVSSREELELLDKTERQQHFNWIADAVTGVSGSGPAYMYLILEAMADEGVRQGLDRQTSYQLAAQTMVGAGKMVISTRSHPGVLKVSSANFSIVTVSDLDIDNCKDEVTSPGGSTAAAIRALEMGGLRGTLMSAVSAAADRCRDMNKS